MRILIIDHNEATIADLRRNLRDSYVIDVERGGVDGINQATCGDYDLIILSLNLPDYGGIKLCQDIRAEKIPTPILAMIEQPSIEMMVLALDGGADDCVIKPLKMDEVKARVRALLRRDSEFKTSEIVAGDLVIDVACRTVSRRGRSITLRRKEFDLLEYLVRNNGRTVTRQMIMDHVWDMNDNLWTNAIDVHIKHIRDRIDRPFDVKSIKTVHGVGYKFVATESVVDVGSPSTSQLLEEAHA